LEEEVWAFVEKCLTTLRGYSYSIHRLDARNFQIPQSRIRICIVCRRGTSTCPHDAWHARVSAIVRACQDTSAVSLRDHFSRVGLPLARPSPATAATQWEICKTCSLTSECPRHRCSCKSCREEPPSSAGRLPSCKWRKHTIKYLSRTRKQMRSYTALWRKVKRSPMLKQAPTYMQLAARQRLPINDVLRTPRQREMVRALSRSQNLMHPDCVIDLSQSITWQHRCRRDGNAPTLARSSQLFMPWYCQKLSAKHSLALQGFNPHLADTSGVSDTQLQMMAGNAMCVPVVGTLLVAVLASLEKS